MAKTPSNTQIAQTLERIADLLEAQDSNPFRIRAYREGAQSIRNHEEPVADFIHQHKVDELKTLPHIGEGIAAVIGEYVSSGQSNLLIDLEAKTSPEDVFSRVPGIGEKLAERLVDQLHIQTLPELEEAVYDGRLAEVEGFGSGRVEGIRTALAGMLDRSARTRQQNRAGNGKNSDQTSEDNPSVELLLEIDAEYRQKAKAGELHKIAPRRFNPNDEAWLPILHTKRDSWDFTVLFSNTAQAHKLEKTDDWVVIYFERNGKERQHTVVSESKGDLKGKRVVRGRDAENKRYYGEAS